MSVTLQSLSRPIFGGSFDSASSFVMQRVNDIGGGVTRALGISVWTVSCHLPGFMFFAEAITGASNAQRTATRTALRNFISNLLNGCGGSIRPGTWVAGCRRVRCRRAQRTLRPPKSLELTAKSQAISIRQPPHERVRVEAPL